MCLKCDCVMPTKLNHENKVFQVLYIYTFISAFYCFNPLNNTEAFLKVVTSIAANVTFIKQLQEIYVQYVIETSAQQPQDVYIPYIGNNLGLLEKSR